MVQVQIIIDIDAVEIFTKTWHTMCQIWRTTSKHCF